MQIFEDIEGSKKLNESRKKKADQTLKKNETTIQNRGTNKKGLMSKLQAEVTHSKVLNDEEFESASLLLSTKEKLLVRFYTEVVKHSHEVIKDGIRVSALHTMATLEKSLKRQNKGLQALLKLFGNV